MRVHLCLDQLQFCQMLHFLFLTDILQKSIDLSCHLIDSFIQFLNLFNLRPNRKKIKIPPSNFFDFIKHFCYRMRDSIGQPEGTAHQDHQCSDQKCGHSCDQDLYPMRQTLCYLYQVHRFIINIILHFLHDQTGNDTDVTVHKFHPFIIFFDLCKLDHPFLQIVKIGFQAFQRLHSTRVIGILTQLLHDRLCILYLTENILQFAALLRTDRYIIHFKIQIILETKIKFTADSKILRKFIVLSCIMPENDKQ